MSKSYNFIHNLPPFMNDVPEIIRAFYPYIIIDKEAKDSLEFKVEFYDNLVNSIITENGIVKSCEKLEITLAETLEYKRQVKRFVKNFLYKACRDISGISLPYGSLTGVRPTKLYYELYKETTDAKKCLIEDFFVLKEKAELIEAVVKNQEGIYNLNELNADIYVHIPFCPSRCRYCSFISTEVSKIKKRLPEYIKKLRKEIENSIETLKASKYNLRSIYVGGGTPTVLNANELKEVLSPLSVFNTEFTVECGRADSISKEKLEALKSLNVTRISINPQTFRQETLDDLGRNHSVEDIYKAFEMAREIGFDINMDLIAGLQNEDLDIFKDTLKRTIALDPENITIHTLSIKRGAKMATDGGKKSVLGLVAQMTDYAKDELTKNGYIPYYMYRQKNMSDNLENTGYAKEGKQCIYNIDYMEEISTILASGAGAVSKFIYPDEERSERKANSKDLNDYLAK